jgi:hypothetical protein
MPSSNDVVDDVSVNR